MGGDPVHRAFSKKDQEKLADLLLKHSKFLMQPNIKLELIDGELIETDGTWRDEKFQRTETDNTEQDDS
jgi:hypothetical protein